MLRQPARLQTTDLKRAPKVSQGFRFVCGGYLGLPPNDPPPPTKDTPAEELPGVPPVYPLVRDTPQVPQATHLISLGIIYRAETFQLRKRPHAEPYN